MSEMSRALSLEISMARKTGKPSEIEAPEIDSEEEVIESEEEDSTASAGSSRSISKAGAARAALAAGYSVPKQASAWIRERFGLDVSPQQFSAEKSRIKLRTGGSTAFFAGGSSSSQGNPLLTTRQNFYGQPDLLQALEVMKPLIEQMGAEKVKRMVDLLG